MSDLPVGDLVDGLMEMKKPDGKVRSEARQGLPHRPLVE